MRNFSFFLLLSALLGGKPQAHSQTNSWYKSFSASIDNYPITIHLHRKGDGYSGFYYYEKTQQPVYITGTDSTGTDKKIHLYAFVPGMLGDDEFFNLSVTGDSLSGEWRPRQEANPLSVTGREKQVAGLSFDMIYTTGSTALRPKLVNSPEASYDMASIWPREKTIASSGIKKKINEIFGVKNSQQDIGPLFLKNKKSFFASYLSDYKTDSDSDIVSFPSNYSLSEEQALLIVYHTPKLLTLANWSYAYTGGAHGNYGTGFISINLANGKTISLNQVLTPAGIKQLSKLLEKNFRKQYRLNATEPLTEAGLTENSIKANDNFYLTGKGLGFSYTPYEIASYAVGEINVFIPYIDLNAYLQPGFKTLIK